MNGVMYHPRNTQLPDRAGCQEALRCDDSQEGGLPMRVLAIDDDHFILEILGLLIARAGYSVVTAVSAAAALERITAAELPFQCILLDINMPGMDGIEFCDVLRRLPDYSNCPIIMISAMSDSMLIEQAYAAGATDYVTKPFEVGNLTARLGLAARSIE